VTGDATGTGTAAGTTAGTAGAEAVAAPEPQIARDMARRALPAAPVLIAVCALAWGGAGAVSSAFAIGLVLGNFLAASWTLATAARINEAVLMGAALFGYLLRLALIFAAVMAVKDASWVEPMALGLSLIVTHLGLLVWELRYVSASLAYPGLRPVAGTKENATR
jgi:hypothetical protein